MTSDILENDGGQPLGEQWRTDGERRRTDSSRLLGRRSRSASWQTAEVRRQLASRQTAAALGGRQRLNSGYYRTAVERQSASWRTVAVLLFSGGSRKRQDIGGSWRTAAPGHLAGGGSRTAADTSGRRRLASLFADGGNQTAIRRQSALPKLFIHK